MDGRVAQIHDIFFNFFFNFTSNQYHEAILNLYQLHRELTAEGVLVTRLGQTTAPQPPLTMREQLIVVSAEAVMTWLSSTTFEHQANHARRTYFSGLPVAGRTHGILYLIDLLIQANIGNEITRDFR